MIRTPSELLTNEQMAEADRLAIETGVPSLTLMENAGRAVADEAVKMVDAGAAISVLCGPGNNGGDGFVAARYLKARGYDVAVYLLGDSANLKGDAAANASRWLEVAEVRPLIAARPALETCGLVIDALFGAGLTRALEGDALEIARACNERRSGALLAVDVPSGLNGSTGAAVGDCAIRADRTITFFRLKPGHVLYPGRGLCGELVLADIGIPEEVLGRRNGVGARGDVTNDSEAGAAKPGYVHPFARLIEAETAARAIAQRQPEKHKYDYGHALVMSGPNARTGAARLAARAALRVGAGLVTVLSPSDALAENSAHLTAIMLRACDTPADLSANLEDRRISALLMGPAFGPGERCRAHVLAALRARHVGIVLDADALTSFEDNAHRDELFAALKETAVETGPRVIMTPHAGEFARLFPDLQGSKIERAMAAAQLCGAVVVLKGADTVVAQPPHPRVEMMAEVATNGPASLATAGSGDVLAGLITGLLAQGAPALEAASGGVWLHGEAARRFGPGLIAEDLPELLPAVLADLAPRPA